MSALAVTDYVGRFRLAQLRPAALGAVGIAAFLVAWEAAGQAQTFGRSIPPFSETLKALSGQLREAPFWQALGQTLGTWAIGFSTAAVVAVAAGLLLNSSALLQRAVRPTIEFLRPIPPVTLLPLALLMFGSTKTMQVTLIVFGCFLPLLTQTLYGLKEIDPVSKATMSTFRVTRPRRVLWLSLPSASPFIATGLRVASTLALLIAITTELLGSAAGLGQILLTATANGEYAEMLAVVAVIGFLGMVVNGVFSLIEKRMLHWRTQS